MFCSESTLLGVYTESHIDSVSTFFYHFVCLLVNGHVLFAIYGIYSYILSALEIFVLNAL